MKSNKLLALWIASQSLLLTLFYLLRCILLIIRHKNSRNAITRFAKRWSQLLLHITQTKRTITYEQALTRLPGRAYLIMSNHTSLYDIPLIMENLPGDIRMLAKKELFNIPLFGYVLAKSEFLSVDRQNRHQAHRDMQIAKAKLQDGLILWIAPEGTRSRTGQLQAFKTGAFQLAIDTEAIIIPVNIQNAHHILPAKTWQFHRNQTVALRVGKPIDSKSFGKKDRKQFMQQVHAEIERLAKPLV